MINASSLYVAGFDRTKLSLYGPGSFAHDLFQLVVSGLEIFLGFLQESPELLELSFYATKDTPHLATAFLDGQRAESHLQAVEDRCQCGRPRDNYVIFLL